MRTRLGLIVLALALAVFAGRAEESPAPDKDKGKLDIPDDTPVILSAKEHRALLEKIAQLQVQLDRVAPTTPSTLALKARIEGNFVYLTAQYKFETTRNNEVVSLGCGPALAVGANFNGKTPRLFATQLKGREGFNVQIAKPDSYEGLTLELVLPLSSRTAGQGFSLDLPHAVATSLELDLPEGAKDVRLLKPTGAVSDVKGNRLTSVLGSPTSLDVEWKSAQAAAAALLSATGKVEVKIDEKQLTTRAELTLRAQGKQVKQWQLLVPANCELAVEKADRIEKYPKQPGLRTVHLKEPTTDPLVVTLTSVAAAPRPNQKVNVGSFHVIGAAKHFGEVRVFCNVPGWHVLVSPRGGLVRGVKESADTSLVAEFTYATSVPESTDKSAMQPWLELEVEPIRGQLRAKPIYTITRLPAPDRELGRWRVRVDLTVTPRQAGIDFFSVSLPSECKLDKDSTEFNDRVRYAPTLNDKVLLYRLKPDAAEGTPAIVAFECDYVFPEAQEVGNLTLPLPRAQDMREQDGLIKVVTHGQELLLPAEGPIDLAEQKMPHEVTYRFAGRTVPSLQVHWRPFHPVPRVDSLIDLTLSGGQTHVRHTFTSRSATGPVLLRVPEEVMGLRIVKGGPLNSRGEGVESLSFATDQTAVLEYSFASPPPAGQVPLFLPRGNCEGDVRVRVWSEPGVLPVVPREWAEQNIEAVAGRDRLPVLVLHSARYQSLILNTVTEDIPGVLIERALVRVTLSPLGEQHYRVSYRLGHLPNRLLVFELPGSAESIGLACSLDRQQVSYEIMPSESIGRRVRLRLPPARPGAVLEVSYKLAPSRVERTALATLLQPPRVQNQEAVSARWSVTAPENWVVLGPEPGYGTTTVGYWRGMLYAPRSQASVADLEAWFAGSDASMETLSYPSFVSWRDSDEKLWLTHVSRQMWLVGCSLLAVVVGLPLTRLAVKGRAGGAAWAWLGGGTLLVGVLALAVFTPALAWQCAYGCQPGLAVVLLLSFAQWLMLERAKSRVVLLSSFAPAKHGSSLNRVIEPRLGEQPSTVDAPPLKTGSNLDRRK